MAVDVVVVNHKTPDLLQGFCESYFKHHFQGCTLTVVDVTLDSPYAGQIAEYFGAVDFIQFIDNVGYARACNAGASEGINDVILLANADTLLSPDFKLCHDELLDHHDWGVLGPRQVDEHNRITAGGIFGTERSIGQRGWNEQDVGQYQDIREDAKSVSGSLYFIKRLVWEQLTECPSYADFTNGAEGAFLPTSFYYEETACSYHARAHGWKIVYYGPAKMIHYWHRSHPRGDWADQQVDVSKDMMRRFCASHDPLIVCE